MKLLALDSSGLVASVAVLEEETVRAEYTLQYRKTHSETLLPMIDTVLRMLEWDISAIDAVALAAGPGSFTGLRIGSATAKGLGLALDIPLIPVPTVDALAVNLMGTTGDRIVPMMDARREQVYTGIYRWKGEELQVLQEQQPMAIRDLISRINAAGEPVTVLGDGVPVARPFLERELTVPLSIAPPHQSRQRAASVGILALQYERAGKVVSAAEHAPNYLRLSQAERERLEKEAGKDL